MNYNFDIPKPRGFQSSLLDPEDLGITAEVGDQIRDMFLHALFARVAANDDENWEFETKYDQSENHIELQIPEKFISMIETVSKGEDFNRYIQWLVKDAVENITQGLLWRLVEGSDDTITTVYKAIFEKSASYNEVKNIGDSSTTATVDWCMGNKQKIIMTDNAAISFNKPPGPASLQLIMIQGGSGSYDPTFDSNVWFPRGAQPGTTNPPGSRDVWSFLYDSDDDIYYATRARDFGPLP